MAEVNKATLIQKIDNLRRYIAPKSPSFANDDQPLQLKLFSHEQLQKHARDLASKHQIGRDTGQDLLVQRLADNESFLLKAYERLCETVRTKKMITPASEWLLDNYHVIEEQILTARRHLPSGYSRELPHLIKVNGIGYPRVYEMAQEVIAHVDGRVDKENITSFVGAYQQVTKLNLGEIWAIPIMLRLALIENLRRVAGRVVIALEDREQANYWADQLIATAEKKPQNLILMTADMARSKVQVSDSFVAEIVRRLQGLGYGLDIPLTWIEQQLFEAGSTTQQTVQSESQQQAANQVLVGASIGSLRFLDIMDWRQFVESLSSIDAELVNDPAQVYQTMSFSTRDNYRHAVEKLAKKSKRSETEVARNVVALANEEQTEARARHVGYYLIGNGRKQLEKIIKIRSFSPNFLRVDRQGRLGIYLFVIIAVTALITGRVLLHVMTLTSDMTLLTSVGLLVMLCSSQVAVALVNWFATLLMKPTLLPRLDFSKGIPEESRTLVAVPSMLLSPANIASLLESLEVRYLGNQDENLHYALLTDFCDAQTETLAADESLITLAKSGIEALNNKYCTEKDQCDNDDIFFLFHRAREWNAGEEVWMGKERKRGKLETLNAYLRDPRPDSFSVIVGDICVFSPVKYVITLDTDTQMPRNAARELAGTISHPLNRPIYDEKLQRVTEGYSILQPRVGVSLPSSRNSWFVRLFCGDAGIDPYSRAISDVYQDLFLEGSFIGKGIYDVDAFSKSLSGKFPDNLILSHDLIEGSYARCGLLSDVLLYEDFPANYSDDAKRRARWIRGDWQIIQWLFPRPPGPDGKSQKNSLSMLSRWKIFDNLRRSLVPIGTLLLLVGSWVIDSSLSDPWFLTLAILAMIFLPQLLTSMAEVATRRPREITWRAHAIGALKGLVRQFLQAFLYLVFLPFEAALNANAIRRSLGRVFFTHKHLLEWRSASDASDSLHGYLRFYSSMAVAPLLALGLGSFFIYQHINLQISISFLILWFFAPAVAAGLSRRLTDHIVKLSDSDTDYLRHLARKTWRFFETFVGPEDHWLPPDNFQEYPQEVTAHRTSPTNIGLALLSNLSAYDFGYLSADNLIKRTADTFATMDKLERFRGHFYNWYDTISLDPLPPLYVSSVDSGNLVGLLLTLRQGLYELPDAHIVPQQTVKGLSDTLFNLSEHVGSQAATTLIQNELDNPPNTLSEARLLNERLKIKLASLVLNEGDDAIWWLKAFERQSGACLLRCQSFLAPITQLIDQPGGFKVPIELNTLLDLMRKNPTWSQVASFAEKALPLINVAQKQVTSNADRAKYTQLSQAAILVSSAANEKILLCHTLARRCDEMATIEYEFLYNRPHQLLSIGYNVSEHRRDNGYYDLLASEARLGSFVGIAKGSLPQEHWFSLGRQLTTWHGSSTLLSWSGSMFEYLMPLLVMPTFKCTLLNQTYLTAVKRQIAYGNEHQIPWGVSESGYNTTDVNLNYQYRAFGVPGLGFKRGLADDLVLAPYASVMAVMVEPEKALKNMKRMAELGFLGRYGFYEAVDYTPSRQGVGQKHTVIKSFMTHHLGMSFLSVAYQVLGQKMQDRFQADPQFKATEMLLHERIPQAIALFPHAPEVSNPQESIVATAPALRIIDTANTPRPEVHLLSNSRYTVMITNSGGGYSRWKDLALTRWREDPTCDNWGTFCYLRDVKSGEVWSTAHQPSLKTPTHYEAIFQQARAEFRRRDHEIELHTEITISPEDDIELRRCGITNLSRTRRTIEFTTYAEVVLAPQAVDEAHPAFSNLFVQTEILAEKQAILCKRRPRSDSELTPTMFHLLTVQGSVVGEVSYETDRSRFIGRGRSINNPTAMYDDQSVDMAGHNLSGQSGSVLDPIVAIRCRVVLEPEETAWVHIVTGVGEKRQDALELIEKYLDRHLADRVFELSWTHRQVVLRQLNVSETDAQLYGRLASSIIYVTPLRRADPAVLQKNQRGQSGLWGYGISGDLPIVVLRIGSIEQTTIIRQMVQAHGYWRLMGLSVDLVIWNNDESGYRQNLQDIIMEIIAEGSYLQQIDKPGGIFLRRSDQMSEEDQILLQTVARAIITDTNGSLANQVERRGRKKKTVKSFVPTKLDTTSKQQISGLLPSLPKDLLCANGTGGFSADGREYVIITSSAQVTPAPWSNVIANPYFGTVVSESGSAYTWCENAHEYRLTPWHNDALTDSSGEAIYIRDEETGVFWSPSPLPVRADAPYITKHGFGYSSFETEVEGTETKLTTFVAIDAPIKINLLKIRNTSNETRQLSVTGYCEWVLGEMRAKSLMHIVSEIDQPTQAIFLRNPFHPEFGGRVGFYNVSETNKTVTGDRSEFVGRNNLLSAPQAMYKAGLSGRIGAALDSCSAMQTTITLEPGDERELVFVLGVARDTEDARTLQHRFGTALLANQALEAVKQHWQQTLGAVQIKTPDPSLDILMNGWLIYQVMSSRMWGRSGFYQSGGAYGFRDQLQDTMALMYAEPQMFRQHLLRCAARQYREGDVQHWWHPPSGFGVRTHFSDDYLWLPLATSRYVLGIGDSGILDKRINFIEGRQVKLDEEAYADHPSKSDESASLYDHCVRAIKHSLKFGRHGLPFIGCGDWNDGMNLVGEHGKGESVWMAFFLCTVLEEFSKVAVLHGDSHFSETCLSNAANLKNSIETNAWDGEWYRRAYFDSGEPLGSSKNTECQIDSIPQSWAVLSGAGRPERAKLAMEKVYHRLVDQENQLIKLFDPPFDQAQPNPGYIKGYVPGVRENGGQYTHAAIWTAMAFAKLGDRERAWELFQMINPLKHGDSEAKIDIYKVEPYVVSADVYGVPPHTGRGGWTWYTGSAGWMYRLILESLLGLRLEINRLYISPCLPASWDQFELRYRFQDTFFDIVISPTLTAGADAKIIIDGVLQKEEGILLVNDRQPHRVEVSVAHD